MKMNFLEKHLMNSSLRGLFLRCLEAPILKRLGGEVNGKRVLEIGCGNGRGAKLLIEKFMAQHVDAVDVDSDMIQIASRRLSGYPSDRIRLSVQNITQLDASPETYDAVFNFGVIHHIPDWQAAVAEVERVLKPGGFYFFEEVTKQWINRWPYRALFEHPSDNRFSAQEFLDELTDLGLLLNNRIRILRKGDFVFGVAQKSPQLKRSVSKEFPELHNHGSHMWCNYGRTAPSSIQRPAEICTWGPPTEEFEEDV